eukprot:177210-Pyramimonas_sp.AAC.1
MACEISVRCSNSTGPDSQTSVGTTCRPVLKNDHKVLSLRLEHGLIALHASARTAGTSNPAPSQVAESAGNDVRSRPATVAPEPMEGESRSLFTFVCVVCYVSGFESIR